MLIFIFYLEVNSIFSICYCYEGKRRAAKLLKVSPAKKPKRSDKGDEKKKRRKKANDGIKKPASAYIYFVSDYRKELKEKGKDTSNVQEVAKICGQKWREMDDEDKKPYTLLAGKDKERYGKEVCVYNFIRISFVHKSGQPLNCLFRNYR